METEREITEREAGQKEINGREDSIRREYDFAPDVQLKECRYCRVMIPKKAKVCPNCRMNLKGHWFRNLVAAVFAVTVIGAGGYYLSEHWGIMKDAVASVWMAQDRSAVPVMSMTTVDSTKTAAEPAAATAEVTRMSEEAEKQAQPAESQTDAEAETAGLTVKAGSRNDSADIEAEQIGDKNAAETVEAEEIQDKNAAASAETKDMENRNAAASAQTEDTENGNAAASVKAQGREQEEQETTETKADAERVTEDAYSETDGTDGQTEEENRTKEQEGTAEESRGRQQEKAVDKQELAFREDCVTAGYKSLLRDTETYLDRALMVEVQVVCQVNGGLFDDNIYYFCKTEDEAKIERYYIVRDDRETDDTIILEGDVLMVFGQLFGTCKIPAEMIETRPTVPAVSMLYYDLTGE